MFKKLKKKIKRALAGFLKEELLDFVGYDHNIPNMTLNDRFRVDQIDFETMVCERRIEIHGNGMDPKIYYEEQLRRTKEGFLNAISEHIHVECLELVNPEFAYQRSIILKLRVQKKQ